MSVASRKDRRGTQRERLVSGMIAAANRAGCAGASVADVIAEAGVSRPTFYEYFADRHDCLQATIAEAQAELDAQIERASSNGACEAAAGQAVTALVEFARLRPAQARFLMSEALAGGPAALDARDRSLHELARAVEAREDSADEESPAPDVPVSVLLGAVQRILGARLRRGAPVGEELRGQLLDWLACYAKPRAAHRWRSPIAAGASPSPNASAVPLHAPAALERGRPRLPAGEVSENHRQRLLFAASELAARSGYAAATVADVCGEAGLDRRAFYAVFDDKRELFMAAQEHAFQRLLAVSASAFFSGADWPQRIWRTASGLSEFLQANPALVHVGLVDAYAVGPGAVQRLEDSVSAFAVFLQEGYRYEGSVSSPPAFMLEAMIWSVYEIVYREVRARALPDLARWSALMSFIALAPFLGASAADAALERELSER